MWMWFPPSFLMQLMVAALELQRLQAHGREEHGNMHAAHSARMACMLWLCHGRRKLQGFRSLDSRCRGPARQRIFNAPA